MDVVLALIAVPHVVFVECLRLLELFQTVCELNSCLLAVFVSLVAIEVLNFD